MVLAITGFLLSGSFYHYQAASPSEDLSASPAGKKYSSMGSTQLPGRPGNLTTDQEAKLQELWTIVFKVFGVNFQQDHGTNGSNFNHDERLRTVTGELEKKKKKKLGMFSRKHSSNDLNSSQTDAPATSEDKYGQTKEFQQTLATVSPEDLHKAFWSMVKHDHPDGLLLRFLRARKWDVHNALVMLVATMHWRLQEMHVDDDVVKKGEGAALEDSTSSDKVIKKEGTDFMTQLRLGKSFLHGTDKEGRPMCVVRVRLHRQGEQSETSLERYTVHVIETARLLMHSNVDTAVRIIFLLFILLFFKKVL